VGYINHNFISIKMLLTAFSSLNKTEKKNIKTMAVVFVIVYLAQHQHNSLLNINNLSDLNASSILMSDK